VAADKGVVGGGWLIKVWRPGWDGPKIVAAKASYYRESGCNSYIAERKAWSEMASCLLAIVQGGRFVEIFGGPSMNAFAES